MKRNMDTVRRILLAVAEMPYGQQLHRLEGISEEEFVVHTIWLAEAGLIEADAQAGAGSMAKYAIIFRLTWAGCDFADAITDETLWRKAKETVITPGLSFTFDLLKDWLKAEIKSGFPNLRNFAG